MLETEAYADWSTAKTCKESQRCDIVPNDNPAEIGGLRPIVASMTIVLPSALLSGVTVEPGMSLHCICLLTE